ncbi:MAG: hypothetical protein ABJL54_00040 [Halioglobus sp.]
MSDKKPRNLAKGGVIVSQAYYDSLPDNQKESGRYIVDDYAPLGAIAGATLLAKKAGFKGGCITPFVYEYLQLERRRRSGKA